MGSGPRPATALPAVMTSCWPCGSLTHRPESHPLPHVTRRTEQAPMHSGHDAQFELVNGDGNLMKSLLRSQIQPY
jgi:hypothetical protein